ncbi:MAG TPA: HEAT repeat domain-containing protein [Thermoanaerobaculia bacterium]|jgi:HEAT repeat protein|nr:HEAT repeat domain-containing protein [Thermoanaerobaculia bacterium]
MKSKWILTLAAALVALAPAVHANWKPDSNRTIVVQTDDDDDRAARDRDRAEQKADKAEKEEDLYDRATDSLDDHDWRRAASLFRKVTEMQMSHADAALYWLAYAQGKMGARSDALSTLLQLEKAYPKSKWVSDGKTLEVEIRQSAGQVIQPEHVGDEDVKLMAINGLMMSDPDRAIPILEGILNGNQPVKLKERALFVLSQSGSPKAFDIVVRTAKSGPPDLRDRAVRTLGILGGERSRGVLTDIYNSTNDVSVKKSILKSYMIAGDRTRLLALAKGESNPELRADAVLQLGVVGGRNELAELYNNEPSVEIRKKILQAMFIGGNSEKLAEIARNEKILELKVTAIRNLGLLGGGRSGELLLSLYNDDPRPEVRKGVIEALFIQGNARTLVNLARAEKDPETKRRIIEKLSVMGSKEATDYLMEFLK